MSASAALDAFTALAEQAIAQNRPQDLPDEAFARALRAAVRAYAFKADKAGAPLEPYEAGSVTATEACVAASAIMRAADLNLWDLSMWFNRAEPPRAGGN